MERQAFTLREVAAATGQSVRTLRLHVKAGRLKAVRPSGGNGRLLVLPADLEHYLGAR